ncbi:hypothetical protein Poli38472_009223 [Pythium oligandrum]|uniref:NADH-ubiquinone oxidoreductase 21kDa subunit N-terminal domain-containing protein n=1 Tax=Pythium oligandrum TaxID=41045 RepID=A0A8K1FJL4_PYTOL|nr:hypothetical protein Poli38472_009223 [Pythium oligandrum]|eukprot:TMW65056.1 hypothetical protein Poli38472_009223 [Pythium oligandrum]
MVMPTEPERVPPVVRDPRVPRFPVVYENPTFDQVVDNINQRDYVGSGVLAGACFPLGYLIAHQIDRKLAVRGMWFTGILGSIGGCLLAYQNSELRLQGFGRNEAEVARFLTPQQTTSESSAESKEE